MRVKRDRQITFRISSELLEIIEREAERQQRTIAGLVHMHLVELYGGRQEPPGKEQ